MKKLTLFPFVKNVKLQNKKHQSRVMQRGQTSAQPQQYTQFSLSPNIFISIKSEVFEEIQASIFPLCSNPFPMAHPPHPSIQSLIFLIASLLISSLYTAQVHSLNIGLQANPSLSLVSRFPSLIRCYTR